MRNWLENKTLILTGASGGIGRQLCKLFIQKYKANVIGIGRSEQKMLTLKEELGSDSERFSYRLFDVSQKANWQAFKTDLENAGIFPIMLVNNAGIFPTFYPALNTDEETTERVLKNNYLATVYAVKAIFPLLKGTEKDKPAIINVASSAALCTVVGTSAYSASKAALKAYTEALQLEEKDRAYVGLVCPGTTATELFREDKNTENSALDKIAMSAEKMAKKIAKRILKKKKRSVVGWDAKCMNFVAKLMPVKGLFLIRWVMKKSKSKVFTNVFTDKND